MLAEDESAVLYSLQLETSRRKENALHSVKMSLHCVAQSTASLTLPNETSWSFTFPLAPEVGLLNRPNRQGARVVVVGLKLHCFEVFSKKHSDDCRHCLLDFNEHASLKAL